MINIDLEIEKEKREYYEFLEIDRDYTFITR